MFSSRCVMSQFVSCLRSVISSFGHDSEIIQEWICDVSASTLLQAIVPRVLSREITWYEVWAIGWHVLFLCTSMLTILEVCLVCKLVGIAFGLGVQQLALYGYWSYAWFCFRVFGIVVHFRDVLVQTADMGCRSYIYSSQCIGYAQRIDLFGDSSEMELHFFFLRCHPWGGSATTTSSRVGLPEDKSWYCWNRWEFLLHACYMLRIYWIKEHRDIGETISMVKNVIEVFGTTTTRHKRCLYNWVGTKDNTGFTSSIPISGSKDDRAERAYGRFIRHGFYQTEYFTVGSIIIFL